MADRRSFLGAVSGVAASVLLASKADAQAPAPRRRRRRRRCRPPQPSPKPSASPKPASALAAAIARRCGVSTRTCPTRTSTRSRTRSTTTGSGAARLNPNKATALKNGDEPVTRFAVARSAAMNARRSRVRRRRRAAAAAHREDGLVGRAHRTVPQAAGNLRAGLQRRRDDPARPRAARGEARRRRARARSRARPAARHPVRRERLARDARRADDVGRAAVPQPAVRVRRDGGEEAHGRRRGAAREARDGRARRRLRLRRRRRVVHRPRPHAVEREVLERRLVERLGDRRGGGAGGIRDRLGDVGFDFVSRRPRAA